MFTERQEYYSDIFRLNTIYTPQAIINGQKEFLGSNKNKLVSSIEEQLDKKQTTSIKLKATQNAAGKIEVNYSIAENNSKGAEFVLIVVQKMATNTIKRGENEGRTLHHINIVREIFYLQGTSKEETKSFDLPAGLNKEDVFVAGLIQDKRSGKIKAIQSSPIE